MILQQKQENHKHGRLSKYLKRSVAFIVMMINSVYQNCDRNSMETEEIFHVPKLRSPASPNPGIINLCMIEKQNTSPYCNYTN